MQYDYYVKSYMISYSATFQMPARVVAASGRAGGGPAWQPDSEAGAWRSAADGGAARGATHWQAGLTQLSAPGRH